jgi:peptide/nickel transport system substrate-binding protein
VTGLRTLWAALWLVAVVGAGAGGAAAQTLRVGLSDDPDMLDPSQARTFTGRTVFAALCDKLVEISPELDIVPQLATEWRWVDGNKGLVLKLRQGVKFHDGEPLDAAAVKFSLERHLTFPGTTRKAEISAIKTVEIIDGYTVKLVLSTPFAPLLAALADRAGMIVSPKAATAAGDNFAAYPVCAGPFKFVERVAQDRIVLDRFADYWNKDQIKFDRVIFLPIPDSTVRLANLLSGGLDIIERVAATDYNRLKGDARVKLSAITGLGYWNIRINVANGERAKQPFGSDPRVRQAFDLAIDRAALNQVVFEGNAQPGNQWMPPTNSYYVKDFPIPTRDVAAAKRLLAEAGVPHPSFELTVPNNPETQQVAQVLQAMAAEAGFAMQLKATETNTALQAAAKGDFDAYLTYWSGRIDPDNNLYNFIACKAPLNDSHYCNPEVDRELDLARTVETPAERLVHYRNVAAQILRDKPSIYLYHNNWLYAASPQLAGFSVYPDGLIRPQGLRLKQQ